MPNTITISGLRAEYRVRFGHDCTLTSSAVMALWRSTATSQGRGRNVPHTELHRRAAQTVNLMHDRMTGLAALPPLPIPYTIGEYIAYLARHYGNALALAEARRLARETTDNHQAEQVECGFVDHSRVIFFVGKLFTLHLTFDIPGESGHAERIEPPWLGPWTEAEAAIFHGRRAR